MGRGLAKKGKKTDRAAKRANDKKKRKVAEDLTFGLKNKKSKKAQKYIKKVNSHFAAEDRAAEKRRLEKLAQRKRERELKRRFGKPVVREEEDKNEDDATAEEVLNNIDEEIQQEEEMTLEDIIEKERAKILEGTPVTLESFKAWKAFKEEQKASEAETLANLRKKAFSKTGTGLSGKELFETNVDVFRDADGAAGKDEYVIDEDLFLDDDEDDEDGATGPVYDPKSWDQPNKPKQLLQEYISRKLKVQQASWPKYSQIDAPSSSSDGGKFMKIVLPHLDNKEFFSPVSYTKKKDAENAAALVAFEYLRKNFIEDES